ncbi:transposase [uncultured Bilophila sp.]|uniref:transposase n=1 Tax=uncultured Bilophila sp. TaxID=529385 RepID=UPI0035A71B78
MSRHDITDEKWAIIGSVLAKASTENRGRKREDDHLMFNAILWIMKTGAPWRDLHPESAPWKTVHKRFLK